MTNVQQITAKGTLKRRVFAAWRLCINEQYGRRAGNVVGSHDTQEIEVLNLRHNTGRFRARFQIYAINMPRIGSISPFIATGLTYH